MDHNESMRGKRRGWVKNAIIIFLAIMLVLTFFSNTIMNRSLPEVATQYIMADSISAKIRGTATVVANSAYDVKVKENRVIQTVAVRLGDTVEVGDVLFLLQPGESADLTELRDQLDSARYSYRLLLLNSPYVNNTADNRNIERLREAVAEAETARDEGFVSDAEIEIASRDVEDAEAEVERLADALEVLEEQLSELSGAGGGGSTNADLSAEYQAVENAQRDYDDAVAEQQTANLIYGHTYAVLRDVANNAYAGQPGTEEAKMAAYAELHSVGNAKEINGTWVEHAEGEAFAFLDAFERIQQCNEAVDLAEEALAAAQTALWQRQQEITGAIMDAAQAAAIQSQIDQLNDEKKSLTKEKSIADEVLGEAEDKLETLTTKKGNYKSLVSAVRTAEDALEDALISLQEKQQAATNEQQKYNLDVEKAKKEIEELEAKIAKAEGKTEDAEGESDAAESEATKADANAITSPVAGIVTGIHISAGSTTQYDTALMTIEERDRGYMASISVTNEQAQKVKLGDVAEVTSNYWGSQITATLATITNDPSQQGQGKLLNFTVEGDVTAGEQLNITLGEKARTYDLVVPNSALRSDANGYFVLIVQTKPSPLGNRYVAARVDVQVLAADDTKSAISGGLVSYDYVITNSSAPLTPGQLVRLVEGV